MMKRIIKHWTGKQYTCVHEWPENCLLQYGEGGLVLPPKKFEEAFNDPCRGVAQVLGIAATPDGAYRTAFFEAFPRSPNTFIRGEGEKPEDAENAAWDKWQKISVCSHEIFETRGFANGLKFCAVCDMSVLND